MWDNDLNSIHKRRSYSTTFKIFLTSNSSRKLKNLHFFDDTFIFCSHFLFLCNMAYNGGLTPTQQKSHPETGAHAFLPPPLPPPLSLRIFHLLLPQVQGLFDLPPSGGKKHEKTKLLQKLTIQRNYQQTKKTNEIKRKKNLNTQIHSLSYLII